eukprot:1157359-Pelagomonas_calceolata.AAC.1
MCVCVRVRARSAARVTCDFVGLCSSPLRKALLEPCLFLRLIFSPVPSHAGHGLDMLWPAQLLGELMAERCIFCGLWGAIAGELHAQLSSISIGNPQHHSIACPLLTGGIRQVFP